MRRCFDVDQRILYVVVVKIDMPINEPWYSYLNSIFILLSICSKLKNALRSVKDRILIRRYAKELFSLIFRIKKLKVTQLVQSRALDTEKLDVFSINILFNIVTSLFEFFTDFLLEVEEKINRDKNEIMFGVEIDFSLV